MLAMFGFWDVYVLFALQSDTPLCKLTSSRHVMMTVGGVCRQAWGRCSRAPGLPADMAHSARSPGQRGGVAGGRQCPRPCQECQQALSATLLAQVLCSHSTTALNNIQCNIAVSDPCDRSPVFGILGTQDKNVNSSNKCRDLVQQKCCTKAGCVLLT